MNNERYQNIAVNVVSLFSHINEASTLLPFFPKTTSGATLYDTRT